MKTLLKVVGALVLILVIVGAVILSKLDPETLGAEIQRRVNESGAAELEAERFELSIRNGLYLEKAEIATELPGGRLDASIAEMRLIHSLPPLLQGQVLIKAIELDQPEIRLTTAAGEPSAETETAEPTEPPAEPAEPTAGTEAEGKELELAIERLAIRDGAFVATTEGASEPDLEIRGLGVEFDEIRLHPKAPPAKSLTARGTLEMKDLRFGATQATGTKGSLSLADGVALIQELGIATAAAGMQIESLEADLNQDPFTYDLKLGGGVDLNTLLASPSKDFGPTTLAVSATGAGPDVGALQATGTLRLDAGTIPAAPMLTKIEALLGPGLISGTAYEATEVRFTVADERVTIEPFSLVSETLALGAAGTADLAGPLALKVQVGADRSRFKTSEIDASQLDAMADDKNWVVIPLNVGGTFQQPDVGLDWKAIKDAAVDHVKQEAKKKVEEEVGKAAEGLLNKLGGRKKR